MNKILTVSIAAYNVEEYIENTLKSLLVNKIDDLEILVEDDGGTDNTAKIVKEYEERYPGIVRLVHKENGGYGSTINKSIELAQGKYFKQLDGDDWYDSENFEKLLEVLRNTDVDAVYTSFKEYKESTSEYKDVDYFEKDLDGIYNIENIINKKNHYLIMHTLLYKTEILRRSNLKLIEHCFYTDTEYAMFPLVQVNTIYITHIPIYIYRIGRKEQSISIESHVKHYEDHVKVSKKIIDFYNYNKEKMTINKRDYIFEFAKLHVANTVVGFYMVLETNRENLNKIIEFDNYISKHNGELYNAINTHSKVLRILRRTRYNYIVYKILAKLKTKKIKSEQK